MKKIRIVFGVAVALLALGVAAVWILANPNRHRERIQAELEKQLGRQVTLGEMTLGLLPPRFQVADPVISENPEIGTPSPFIRAEKVDLRIGLLPLLRGAVRVDSLALHRPSVELIKTEKGEWNFATLGPAAVADPAVPPGEDSGREFALNRLTIVDGQIGVTDRQRKTPRTGYDHIDLTILNYGPGERFSFDAAARIQGEGTQQLRLKGEGGPIASANPAGTPIQGTLSLDAVGINALLKFFDTGALPSAEGVLSGESLISSESGRWTFAGKLRLDRPRLNQLDIGYPITLDHKLAADPASGIVTIETATLALGETPLAVSGTVNTARATPVMDLKIKSGDASIAEIARLASAFGVAFAPGTTVNGRVSADLSVKGTAARPAVAGNISGRGLQISGQGVPQPVEVPSVELSLSPSAIQSSEFKATSGKSTVIGRFALLDYASNSPTIDLNVRAPGATLPEIQSIAKAYGLTGLEQIQGQGAMDFDLRANGPMKSLSSAAAIRALNGTVNLDFSPLEIDSFDAAHELAKLGGFASSVTDNGSTDVLRLAGKILVKNGIAQTEDLRANLAIGNLYAAGTADLAAEILNLKLAAVFTKEFSTKAGATSAGEFMQSVMSNSNGELVIPAIVTGSFKSPKFAPDLQAIARMQRQRLLPTLQNPGSAIRDLLGLRGAKPEDGEPQTTEPQQPSRIRGILDLLGGKKTNNDKK